MTEQQKPPSRLQQIRDFIKPPDLTKRMEDKWGVLKQIGGLAPTLQQDDVEQRRQEIINVMHGLTKIEFEIINTHDVTELKRLKKEAAFEAYKLSQLFNLFFTTGSPWVRGKDNSELSMAVSYYVQNYQNVGHLPSALPYLHTESMVLLHLSWQGIDVTTGPPVLMQVMQPQNGYNQMTPTSGGDTSQTYQVKKPSGGPYPESKSNNIG